MFHLIALFDISPATPAFIIRFRGGCAFYRSGVGLWRSRSSLVFRIRIVEQAESIKPSVFPPPQVTILAIHTRRGLDESARESVAPGVLGVAPAPPVLLRTRGVRHPPDASIAALLSGHLRRRSVPCSCTGTQNTACTEKCVGTHALGRARHTTRWPRGRHRHSSGAVRLALGRPASNDVRAVRVSAALIYEPSTGRQESACARAE